MGDAHTCRCEGADYARRYTQPCIISIIQSASIPLQLQLLPNV